MYLWFGSAQLCGRHSAPGTKCQSMSFSSPVSPQGCLSPHSTTAEVPSETGQVPRVRDAGKLKDMSQASLSEFVHHLTFYRCFNFRGYLGSYNGSYCKVPFNSRLLGCPSDWISQWSMCQAFMWEWKKLALAFSSILFPSQEITASSFSASVGDEGAWDLAM